MLSNQWPGQYQHIQSLIWPCNIPYLPWMDLQHSKYTSASYHQLFYSPLSDLASTNTSSLSFDLVTFPYSPAMGLWHPDLLLLCATNYPVPQSVTRLVLTCQVFWFHQLTLPYLEWICDIQIYFCPVPPAILFPSQWPDKVQWAIDHGSGVDVKRPCSFTSHMIIPSHLRRIAW